MIAPSVPQTSAGQGKVHSGVTYRGSDQSTHGIPQPGDCADIRARRHAADKSAEYSTARGD